MSEEDTNKGSTGADDGNGAEGTAGDSAQVEPVFDRKHPEFQKRIEEIRDLKAKIAEFNQSKQDAARAAEEQAQIARGEFETVKQTYADRISALESEKQRIQVESDLKLTLALEVTQKDPVWMRGAMAGYDITQGSDGIADYLEQLKEQSPQYFTKPEADAGDPGLPPPAYQRAGGPTKPKSRQDAIAANSIDAKNAELKRLMGIA